MTVRVFMCRHCDHMVRLGAVRCGKCQAWTPVLNWTVTHVVVLGLLAIFGAGVVALLPL